MTGAALDVVASGVDSFSAAFAKGGRPRRLADAFPVPRMFIACVSRSRSSIKRATISSVDIAIVSQSLFGYGKLVELHGLGKRVAVGTAIAGRPPRRSVRAELPHTALARIRASKRASGYGCKRRGAGIHRSTIRPPRPTRPSPSDSGGAVHAATTGTTCGRTDLCVSCEAA